MSTIIALQLYTVRDETAKNFTQTLRRVAEIGYTGVELAGYGDLSSHELSSLLSEYGLQAVSSHVSLQRLAEDLDREIGYCLDLHCPSLIVPWVDPEIIQQEESLRSFADQLNDYGHHCKHQGVTLGYHNHWFEFEKVGDDYLLDHLIVATDPAYVRFELDTYWAAYSGADPIALIKKYGSRIPMLHLKDMSAERTFTEVGTGTLDIAGYIKAAQAVGITTYIVEHDAPTIPSLDSARISFEQIQRSFA